MKNLLLILALIISLQNVSAVCIGNQININSASVVELEDLTGIGPAYAQRIVESRPFASVEELIKVKGIGPTTLSKIKFQGLACVAESAEPEAEKVENNTEETEETDEENKKEPVKYFEPKSNQNTATGNGVQETINLNPDSKDIKSEKSKNSDTKRYATYGFVAFLVFLALLFILRRNSKNEIV